MHNKQRLSHTQCVLPTPLPGHQIDIPQEQQQDQTITFQVQGIHCASCVMVIERQLKKLEGVHAVRVDALTGKAELSCARVPLLEEAQQAVQANGYTVLPWQDGKPAMMPRSGVRDTVELGISERMSYGVVFVIGLVASISSCMAVTGGLLLGMTAIGRSRLVKAQGTLLFHLGRLLSYTTFGAVLGGIGSSFTLSPPHSLVAVILSSFVMLLLGMQLLRLVPPWIRALQPRLPRFLTHALDAASGRLSTIASFLIGAATFFLPCGFTQALQLETSPGHGRRPWAVTLAQKSVISVLLYPVHAQKRLRKASGRCHSHCPWASTMSWRGLQHRRSGVR